MLNPVYWDFWIQKQEKNTFLRDDLAQEMEKQDTVDTMRQMFAFQGMRD